MASQKYLNGYVYRINNLLDRGKFYIGSTFQSLDKRFLDHCYRGNYIKGSKYNYPLYVAMRELGFDNFEIELIETLNNCNKMELLRLEGHYQKTLNPCYNRLIAGRTQKELYQDIREQKLNYQKEYAQKNKEHIMQYQKQYRIDNKEKIRQKDKQYREKTYICPCNPDKELKLCKKSQHNRTLKHIKFIESQETKE